MSINLIPYAKGLLSVFDRRDILDDADCTRDIIKNIAQPSYEAALPAFKSWKFKNRDLKDLIGTFDSNYRGHGNDNIVVSVSKAFEPALENLAEVRELIKKTFGSEVSGPTLGYMKTNMIKFVETASFVGKYSIKLLNYIYLCETGEHEDGDAIKEGMTKAEIEWLTANMYNFSLALRVVTGNPGQVKKQLLDVPDVEITEATADSIAETYGKARIDPLLMGFLPVMLNPFYHIRMPIATYQANRYKAAQQELALLELRKMNLEMSQDGKPDASVQKQIAGLVERCEKLNYELAKMEEAYA